MNKKFFFIFLFFIHSFMQAHSLLLNVFDNKDNTITIEGVFTTGELASGAKIILKSMITGEVLYKKRLPIESELTIDIPKEPYMIILNGGPRHQSEKVGIAPLEGFTKTYLKKEKIKVTTKSKKIEISSNTKIIVAGIVVSFLLLLLTIFVSIKNTNKIILQLRELK